jgi:hypothetical protein
MERRLDDTMLAKMLQWKCESKVASAEGGLCKPRART